MKSFTDSLSGPALWLWWFLIAIGFVGAMLFPVLYHFGSRETNGYWRRSEMGRHLMAFSLAVGYALLALLLRVALGDYPGRALVNFSSIFALVGVVWWRSVLYLRLRKQQPQEVDRDVV